MYSLLFFAALTLLAEDKITIVTLGDSITKGVRPGVKNDETFSAYLQQQLREKKLSVTVINAGIGGERTDQGLTRLPKLLAMHKPTLVTIMYGHNDSHIDRGKTKPRLSREVYEANLRKLVEQIRKSGAKVVLMTPPCYSKKSRQGGVTENPNVQLSQFAESCRKVAKEMKVPLIDHYAQWHKELDKGDDTAAWTTDLYHPNPKGHKIMATTMVGVIREVLK